LGLAKVFLIPQVTRQEPERLLSHLNIKDVVNAILQWHVLVSIIMGLRLLVLEKEGPSFYTTAKVIKFGETPAVKPMKWFAAPWGLWCEKNIFIRQLQGSLIRKPLVSLCAETGDSTVS
jgi:hypothetical protein